MWIYIIITIVVLLSLYQYKTKEGFTGKCLYFTVFNKYRDPYSIYMWRDMYDRHRRWNDIHRINYVSFSKFILN